MLQIVEALKALSLTTDARAEDVETLGTGGYPCIVHLRDPDHFVVVANIDDRERMHVYDGLGRRTTLIRSSIKARFGGEVLYVRRNLLDESLGDASHRRGLLPAPHIQFKTLLVDRGAVSSAGEPIAFVYPFHNSGNADLHITAVHPDCKCVQIQAPKQPIPPGGDGDIKLYYHVSPQKGPFTHRAIIETDDPICTVVPIQASGYNGADVSIHPPRLNLGEVVQGHEHTASCFVTYNGDDVWDFDVDELATTFAGSIVRSHSSKVRTAKTELVDQLMLDDPALPGNVRLIELTFTPMNNVGDKLEGTISFHTNVRGFEYISVPVKATVISPIKAYPSIVNFGDVSDSGHLRDSVTLVSVLQEPFQILGVEPLDHDLRYTYPTEVVERESKVVITASEAGLFRLRNDGIVLRIKLISSNEVVTVPLETVVLSRHQQ